MGMEEWLVAQGCSLSLRGWCSAQRSCRGHKPGCDFFFGGGEWKSWLHTVRWQGEEDAQVNGENNCPSEKGGPYLPSRCWKHVLVPLIPTSIHNLPWMGLQNTQTTRRDLVVSAPSDKGGKEYEDGREVMRDTQGGHTSSFSTRVSTVILMSSCTSKWNRGPDFPRALFTIK